MQIILESSFFTEPLSAAALRGDVLGATLKAVKLAWHADEVHVSWDPGRNTPVILHNERLKGATKDA